MVEILSSSNKTHLSTTVAANFALIKVNQSNEISFQQKFSYNALINIRVLPFDTSYARYFLVVRRHAKVQSKKKLLKLINE